jgi:predicted transcriptional regulator
MTAVDQLAVVSLQGDTAEALNKLTQRHVGQLAVLCDEQMVGLLRRHDIA